MDSLAFLLDVGGSVVKAYFKRATQLEGVGVLPRHL